MDKMIWGHRSGDGRPRKPWVSSGPRGCRMIVAEGSGTANGRAAGVGSMGETGGPMTGLKAAEGSGGTGPGAKKLSPRLGDPLAPAA